MTSGYSGTPLPVKLGIKDRSRVLLDGAPAGFDLDVGDVHRRRTASPYDVGVLFAPDRARLVKRWPVVHAVMTPAGRLWVAWPKKASGVTTDLDESAVRDHGLAKGRVDVKICAIDATWSGLCFVVRVKDR
ncbi:MAG: hypothetical protein JWM40_2439 [Frankiales bacterium]|nr:hypothetical protein [Frankiales bacterium]